MIEESVEKLLKKINLSPEEMQAVMEEIMTGKCLTGQIVAFLEALSKKGETVEEITAAAKVMRSHAVKIKTDKEVILDTCGTGGDKKGTFNVSTITAFVAAGCGVTVAKHGNKAVSSSCGSADILSALGINIQVSKEAMEECLDKIGIAFLFAPNLHPAMKHAMEARKQIGHRTIFNIMGPLCNPASATHQLIGVFDQALTETVASVLGNMGTKHALVVYGKDGLDEITLTDKTCVCEWRNSMLDKYEISPEDFGFRRVDIGELLGGNVHDNCQIMLEVLNGKHGHKRNTVLLNSAAALYAADKVNSIKEGLSLAEEAIDSGRALKKLALLKEYTR